MSGIMGMLLGAKTAIAAAVDEFFNRVTLLLPGDGTNGAQNNTFLDSSTNNFTITRNGNTTQGTFSPFSQTGWSNYFAGGANQWIQAPYNAAFDFGTNDFSVECFAYVTDAGRSFDSNKYGTFVSGGAAVSLTNLWTFYFRIVSGVISEIYFAVNGTNQLSITSQSISLNAWHHFVVCRTGSTLSIFVDGTRIGTITYSSAVNTNSSGQIVISQDTYQDQFQNWLIGYMSNVRIIKGTQPYNAASSTITQPTSPLTNITNTSLLTCQSNRFVDNGTANGGNPFTITVTGTPSVQAFSPFAPTAAYDAATVGGSGYFDGSGDYLSVPSSSNLAFGTGDFCVEFWLYRTGTTGGVFSNAVNSGGGDAQFEIQLNGTNKVVLIGWNTTFMTGATTINTNTWYHIAVVRSGTSMAIFVNGTRDATATSSNNFSSTNAFVVGLQAAGSGATTGYISSLRAVKGSFVYNPSSTTVTIPTEPVTAITNTQLLLNYTNAGITDATAKNDLETIGNAQISTTQSKFGGSSMYFDGTGDYLLMSDNPDLELESGDFTIEAWVYLTALNTERNIISKNASLATCGAYILQVNSSNVIKFYASNSTSSWVVNNVGTGTISQNTWTHVAVTRSGSTFTVWVNGTSSGTATSSLTLINQTVRTTVGANENGSLPWLGYIDDLRITKGYARYTANFTPPTAAFPLQ